MGPVYSTKENHDRSDGDREGGSEATVRPTGSAVELTSLALEYLATARARRSLRRLLRYPPDLDEP